MTEEWAGRWCASTMSQKEAYHAYLREQDEHTVEMSQEHEWLHEAVLKDIGFIVEATMGGDLDALEKLRKSYLAKGHLPLIPPGQDVAEQQGFSFHQLRTGTLN
jgi:hypothetical protein